ncbi:MAG: ATP-binding protein [Calditrichaceae bacterium]
MISLSQKIGLGYLVIIFINIVVAVVAIYNINNLSKPIGEILKEKYGNVSASENMLQALSQLELIHLSMIEDGIDSLQLANFQTYKNEFLNWHQQAIAGIALSSEPVILDSLYLAFNAYQSKSDSLHALLFSNMPYKTVKRFHYAIIFPVVKQIEKLCSRLKTVNEEAIAEADMKSRSISSRSKFYIIIFSLILIVFSILAGFYFTHKILLPIKKTTETVRRISRGKMNQKVEITTDDEIAELGLEFNRMTARLDTYEKMNINQIIREKRKSEALVSNIPAAIIVTDPDNRLSLANDLAESILEMPIKDSAGKPVEDLISDKTLLEFITAGHPDVNKETDPSKSLININKNGMDYFYFARQISLDDPEGKNGGKVTLLQDVTSFKNLDRLKSEFIATISHELKTPLTSMNMAIDILSREVTGKLNDEQKELIAGAKDDVMRLKQFVNDLLDISKLESGKINFNFERINPQELIEYILKPFTLRINDKKIKIIQEIGSTGKSFSGDFNQLARVFSNLIDNAVQHTPEHGTITINLKKYKNNVRFCITDSGEGIPNDAIDLIFDKFIQIKNFQQADQGHIGLGLAIAREIIRIHKGRIWVENNPGKGSSFYVEIPKKQNKTISRKKDYTAHARE